jgi:predicted Zn-dependent protease
MAHVTGRHGMRNVAHSAGIVLGLQLLLGDASGWVALAAEVGRLAMQNGYSRDQEAEADAEGARTMKAAGLNPEALAGFFESMKSVKGSELPGALGWLSTHPDHQTRIDHIHALARELPPSKARKLDVDWQAVKEAVRLPRRAR